MLLGFREKGERPDLILFADTGGEKPETYTFVSDVIGRLMSEWDWPRVEWVHRKQETLEEECLRTHGLPSIVVGIRSCSDKYKIRPVDDFLKTWQPAIDAWSHGEKIVKCIGFDAEEPHRIKQFSDARFTVRYPLVEWGWGRKECIKKIEEYGLEIPPKSSCFFCPEMKESEIIDLKMKHPELFERALRMERNNSSIYSVKGLSRQFSWKQIADFHDKQMTLPHVGGEMPCTCYDGAPEDKRE